MDSQDQIWLYEEQTGAWVKIAAKKTALTCDQDELKCGIGEIQLFSRHAFRREEDP
jgi:hypothetical protein